MKKRCTWAAMAATGLLTMVGVAGKASAQCAGYTVTTGGGAVIDPGTVRIDGAGADDSTFAVPGGMPFAWNYYGAAIAAGSTVGACSNGFLLFGSTAISSFSNQCPMPSSTMGVTLCMLPFWDDQITTDLAPTIGRGIFTSVSGVAPNRVFNIEWRNRQYNNTNPLNYEIRIYESQTYFDYIYGTMSVAGTATVGCQKSNVPAVFTSVSCNSAAIIPSGTVYRFDCPASTPPTGVGSANPGTVDNDGLATTLLSVLVTPATGPASTAHTVTGDLTSIGGAAAQTFYDDGTHGDAVANDLRFSYLTTVTPGTPAGARNIPFVVQETAPLTRSSNGTFSVTVATGACCINGNCIAITSSECAASGGVYAGAGTLCGTGTCCLPGGCQVMTQCACTASGGTYGGNGTVCNSCSCQPPIVNDDCVGALPAVLGNNPFDGTCATTSVPAAACGALGSDLWYSFTPTASGQLTVSTCALSAADTAVAIYTDCNTSLACNDDSCGLQSSISACVTGGTPYLLRIGGFAGTHWVGSFSVALSPAAPALTATAAPACGGVGTVLTLTGRKTTPSCSAETLTGVTVDCTQIDAGSVALHDDGLPPDAVAGDGTFSGNATVGAAATGGIKTLTYAGNFSGGSTASATQSFTVPGADETGDLPATAVVAPGPSIVGTLADANCGGVDVDMYVIHICDPASFTATVNPVVTTYDTQLFLFRMDGTGVAMNDDDPSGVNGLRSRLNGPIVQGIAAGDYLLAISHYDKDPVDASGNALWLDTPFNTVRAPDGPAAANPVASWDAGSTVGGPYQIDMTGSSTDPCGPGPCCRTDFNGDGDVGTDADIQDFFACLGGNCCATCPPDSDYNCDGDAGTDLDIQSFFSVLGGGPCL